MVRHVILWKLKEGYTPEEQKKIKQEAKEALENLIDKVPTLMSISVYIDPLPTSNCDMMLDSLFEDVEGLAAYASHPEHVAVALWKAAPALTLPTRSSTDFNEKLSSNPL